MSKLQELIQELCPDGVKLLRLGDIATISRGGSFQKKILRKMVFRVSIMGKYIHIMDYLQIVLLHSLMRIQQKNKSLHLKTISLWL